MKSFTKASLRAPVVSLASQGSGLIQLLLIVTRAGTNEATDTYYYLFNLGMVPIFCIVVGMMYPALLNDERMSRRGLRTIQWVTPVLSITFVGGGVAWLYVNERLHSSMTWLVAACAINALVQTQLWYRAVAAEAGGSAIWISGIALPPNVVAVLCLALPWSTPEATMTAMVVGLVAGNVGLLVCMERRGVGRHILESAPEDAPRRGAAFWFLGLSSVSFIGQMMLQSLAVLLPPSGITLLNVAYKIVGSVSATFVNAMMPALLHQDTDSPHAARRFLRLAVVVLSAAGTLMVTGVLIFRPDLTTPAVVIAIWLVASSASAAANRMSFRFLPPQALRRTISVVVVVSGLALVSAQVPGFSLIALLCAYAAVDAASGMLLLWPLRDRVMSAVLATTLVVLLGIWVLSYV